MLAPVSEEMIEAGLQHYSEGGCSGLADYERREVVKDILTAGMEVFGSLTPDERSEYWRGAYDRMAARSIEDGAKIRELQDTSANLHKQCHEMADWIRSATSTISEAIGGGSEMFIRRGDAYRIDPRFVADYIGRRRDDLVKAHTALARARKETTP